MSRSRDSLRLKAKVAQPAAPGRLCAKGKANGQLMRGFCISWLTLYSSWLSYRSGKTYCSVCTKQHQANVFTKGCDNFRTSTLTRPRGGRQHPTGRQVRGTIAQVRVSECDHGGGRPPSHKPCRAGPVSNSPRDHRRKERPHDPRDLDFVLDFLVWCNLPFYLFCHLIHVKSQVVTIYVQLLFRGDRTRQHRQKAQEMNNKLRGLWAEYTANTRSARGLLTAGSRLICPGCEEEEAQGV